MKKLFFKKNKLFVIAAFFGFAVLSLLSACTSKNDDLTVNYGYNYFPTDSSHYITYQIDSVVYSKFRTQGKDTISVQLKQVWGEPYTDNEGRHGNLMYRYVRYDNDNTPWHLITPTVWYATTTQYRAETMEGALRFINLAFPVQQGYTWNGNTFINAEPNTDLDYYKNWNYEYTEVDKSKIINNLTFDSTATILQHNYTDSTTFTQGTQKLFSQEIYARNVGLVYKRQQILFLGSKPFEEPTTWPDRAENGYIMTQQVIDYKH